MYFLSCLFHLFHVSIYNLTSSFICSYYIILSNYFSWIWLIFCIFLSLLFMFTKDFLCFHINNYSIKTSSCKVIKLLATRWVQNIMHIKNILTKIRNILRCRSLYYNYNCMWRCKCNDVLSKQHARCKNRGNERALDCTDTIEEAMQFIKVG
jgi:hypothetical protein